MPLKPYMMVNVLDGRIRETISMPTPSGTIMVRVKDDPMTMVEINITDIWACEKCGEPIGIEPMDMFFELCDACHQKKEEAGP